MNTKVCSSCNGGRLKKESLAVKFNGLNISEVTNRSIEEAKKFFENISLTEREKIISKQILKEITSRIEFLLNVGLDYLTLDRSARSLSGGESQRIRLATQIGTQLAGVLYVLDEPSIGLHQNDNEKLINSIEIIDISGNYILMQEPNSEEVSLNLESFSKGIYFIKIQTENDFFHDKLIID